MWNGLSPGAIAELFAKANTTTVLTDDPFTIQTTTSTIVTQVRIIDGEDWAGMWIDDVLVYQNHTIRVRDIERYVGQCPMSLLVVDATDELNRWLFDMGSFVATDTFDQAWDRVL